MRNEELPAKTHWHGLPVEPCKKMVLDSQDEAFVAVDIVGDDSKKGGVVVAADADGVLTNIMTKKSSKGGPQPVVVVSSSSPTSLSSFAPSSLESSVKSLLKNNFPARTKNAAAADHEIAFRKISEMDSLDVPLLSGV